MLASGSARAFDGVNIFDSEYFAADLETEVKQKRIAENLIVGAKDLPPKAGRR